MRPVCGPLLALLALWAAPSGLAAGQERAPAPGSTGPLELIQGSLEAVVMENGRDLRVEVIYEFAGAPEHAEGPVPLLAVTGGRTVLEVEALEGSGWAPVSLSEVAHGRWEGAASVGGRTLRLRYRVPAGYARDEAGGAALDLPVLAVANATGNAAPGRFRIRLTLGEPASLRAPFPSNLSAVEGEAGVVVGSAPVVPGMVRFGSGSLLGPARPPDSWPGATFWGLWIALALLLGGYVAWMLRTEGRNRGAAAASGWAGEAP